MYTNRGREREEGRVAEREGKRAHIVGKQQRGGKGCAVCAAINIFTFSARSRTCGKRKREGEGERGSNAQRKLMITSPRQVAALC